MNHTTPPVHRRGSDSRDLMEELPQQFSAQVKKFTMMAFNEHSRICKSKDREQALPRLPKRPCLYTGTFSGEEWAPSPLPLTLPQVSFSLPTAQNNSRKQQRWCLPLTLRELFFSVFPCSIFTLQISLDVVSLGLFYNTRILFCLYCVFPDLICFTLSVLMLSCMHKTQETSRGCATFSINKLKGPGGRIIFRHTLKIVVQMKGTD